MLMMHGPTALLAISRITSRVNKKGPIRFISEELAEGCRGGIAQQVRMNNTGVVDQDVD